MDSLITWYRPILISFFIILTIVASIVLYRRFGHKNFIAFGWWAFFTFIAVLVVLILFVTVGSVIENNRRYPSVVDLSTIEQLSEEQIGQTESAIIMLGMYDFISGGNDREYPTNHPTRIRDYRFGWEEKKTRNNKPYAIISVEIFRGEEYAKNQMQTELSRLISHNYAFTYIEHINGSEAILGHPRTSVSASGWYIPSDERLIISWIQLEHIVIKISESRSSNDLDYGENITSRYIDLLVGVLQNRE